jgi:hypothetical protein
VIELLHRDFPPAHHRRWMQQSYTRRNSKGPRKPERPIMLQKGCIDRSAHLRIRIRSLCGNLARLFSWSEQSRDALRLPSTGQQTKERAVPLTCSEGHYGSFSLKGSTGGPFRQLTLGEIVEIVLNDFARHGNGRFRASRRRDAVDRGGKVLSRRIWRAPRTPTGQLLDRIRELPVPSARTGPETIRAKIAPSWHRPARG